MSFSLPILIPTPSLPLWYHIIWNPDLDTEESDLNTRVSAELVVPLAGGGWLPQKEPIRGA